MIRSLLSSANYKSECQFAPLAPDEETRGQLTIQSQSTTLPRSLVLLAKMILAGAGGIGNTEDGRRVGAAAFSSAGWKACMTSSARGGRTPTMTTLARA